MAPRTENLPTWARGVRELAAGRCLRTELPIPRGSDRLEVFSEDGHYLVTISVGPLFTTATAWGGTAGYLPGGEGLAAGQRRVTAEDLRDQAAILRELAARLEERAGEVE